MTAAAVAPWIMAPTRSSGRSGQVPSARSTEKSTRDAVSTGSWNR